MGLQGVQRVLRVLTGSPEGPQTAYLGPEVPHAFFAIDLLRSPLVLEVRELSLRVLCGSDLPHCAQGLLDDGRVLEHMHLDELAPES